MQSDVCRCLQWEWVLICKIHIHSCSVKFQDQVSQWKRIYLPMQEPQEKQALALVQEDPLE